MNSLVQVSLLGQQGILAELSQFAECYSLLTDNMNHVQRLATSLCKGCFLFGK